MQQQKCSSCASRKVWGLRGQRWIFPGLGVGHRPQLCPTTRSQRPWRTCRLLSEVQGLCPRVEGPPGSAACLPRAARSPAPHCGLQAYVRQRQGGSHRAAGIAALRLRSRQGEAGSRVHLRTQPQFSEIPALREHRAPVTAVEQTALDRGCRARPLPPPATDPREPRGNSPPAPPAPAAAVAPRSRGSAAVFLSVLVYFIVWFYFLKLSVSFSFLFFLFSTAGRTLQAHGVVLFNARRGHCHQKNHQT